MPDMSEAELHDAIVIGAGFAGLVAARDPDRGGPQGAGPGGPGPGRRTHLHLHLPGTDVVIDLGAEWFDPQRHHFMAAEVNRYGGGSSKRTRTAPTGGTWTDDTVRERNPTHWSTWPSWRRSSTSSRPMSLRWSSPRASTRSTPPNSTSPSASIWTRSVRRRRSPTCCGPSPTR